VSDQTQTEATYGAPEDAPPVSQATPAPTAPEKKANVFAILAIIFTFLAAPLGLIFSFVGLAKAGKLGTGKALSAIAMVLSLTFSGVGGFVVYKVLSLDPGCAAANKADDKYSAILNDDNTENPAAAITAMRGMATDLNAAAELAEDPDIKMKIQALATDYQNLATAAETGDVASVGQLTTKGQADEDAVNAAC
jgi:hypothetical protein